MIKLIKGGVYYMGGSLVREKSKQKNNRQLRVRWRIPYFPRIIRAERSS